MTPGFAFGQFNNSFTPWVQPNNNFQFQGFNGWGAGNASFPSLGGFGSFGTFGSFDSFGTFPSMTTPAANVGNSASGSTSSSSSKAETFDEYTARMRKNSVEKREKIKEINKEIQTISKGLDKDGKELFYVLNEEGKIQTDEKGTPSVVTKEQAAANGIAETSLTKIDSQENIEKQKKKLEAAKKADGSAVISMSAEEYEKKVPWWQRAGRALGNMAQGTFKMAKSLVGFDENGKWSLTKCLKNVAIVAAGVALTAVCPAAGPVLLYAGLAAGVGQIGIGTYKAFIAKNVQEIDNAWQDVGVGVATAVASRNGLKSMAKSAEVSMYKPLELISSKASEGALNFAGRRINWDSSKLPKLSSLKFWGKNQEKFDTAQQSATNNCQSRIAEIDTKLNDPATSMSEKLLLQNEKAAFESSLSKLNSAQTKADYTSLATESDAHQSLTSLKQAAADLNAGRSAQIGTGNITATQENITMVNSAIERTEALTKQLEAVTNTKTALMRSMAKNPYKLWKNKQELTNYTETNGRFKAAWNILGKNQKKQLAMKAVPKGLMAFCPEFILWQPITRQSFMIPFKTADIAFNKQNYHEQGMLNGFIANNAVQTLTPEQYEQNLASLTKQENKIKESLKAYDTELQKLYS